MTSSTPGNLPRVSVVVPVWNESRHIEHCMTQLTEQTYPSDRLEVLVVDALSDDGTRDIVSRFIEAAGITAGASRRARIRLIEAPRRDRSAVLNAGIRQASGEVIARVDARTVISSDYIERCVRTLITTGADNVGGLQKPIARGTVQQAIGLAMSHPFGAGNAQFRIGKRSGFVDTVYLGCFRRSVFDRVGLFDEESVLVSEDSDVNQRIRESGGRVYLDTGIVVGYYPRETLPALWRLYFRYGGARAGNFLKHGNLTSWRQIVPAAFVLVLMMLGMLSVVSRPALVVFCALLALYTASDLAVAASISASNRNLKVWPWLCAAFPCMHFGWAFGFLRRLTERRRTASSWAWTER